MMFASQMGGSLKPINVQVPLSQLLHALFLRLFKGLQFSELHALQLEMVALRIVHVHIGVDRFLLGVLDGLRFKACNGIEP